MTIPARFSDGGTSQVRQGVITVDALGIVFRDALGERFFVHADVRVPPRLGNTPRQIDCLGGGLLEVADNDALDAALVAAGRGGSGGWLHGLESRWRRLLPLLVGGVLVLWLIVAFGVPALVRVALPLVPSHIDAALGEQVLLSLDAPPFNLGASRLDDATRTRILTAWEARLAPQATRPVRVLFRHGGWVGANALALPGGNLILTDELVLLAENDEEILAALAHELGHEEHRHAMQALLESLTLLAAMALITGDVGSLAVAAPYALVNSRYSREKEVVADAYAHAALADAGIAPSRLGDMLLKLEAAHGGDGEEAGWTILLGSHPATSERVATANSEKQ